MKSLDQEKAQVQELITIFEERKAFDLVGTSQPNQKFLLCVLCASVVKNLFTTGGTPVPPISNY